MVQIFKTKFTDTDVSSGAEELQVSFPYQSFEEKAVRMLRLRKRRVRAFGFVPAVEDEENGTLTVSFTTPPTTQPVEGTDISCSITVTEGSTTESLTTTLDATGYANGSVVYSFPKIEPPSTGSKTVNVVVTYNGIAKAAEYSVDAE